MMRLLFMVHGSPLEIACVICAEVEVKKKAHTMGLNLEVEGFKTLWFARALGAKIARRLSPALYVP